jgi:hypothetical protein
MAATNLPAQEMTIEKALAVIKEKHPEEAKFMEAVLRKDIVALGVDEAFALRDKDGEIKAFKSVLRLSTTNGGLVKLPFGGPNDNHIVSAQGYEMWAEKAAAAVIFPSEVMVYGKAMENPAPIKDDKGNWSGWVVRAAAFRLTSQGIPSVSDRTVYFDINNRKNIEFLAKAKKYKQAFRILAAGAKAPEDAGTWISYPFDQYSMLWVDASHGEALDWYAEISQMMKNSLQLAQTHAARNSLKHLSALQKAPGPVWDIPIISWRPMSGGIIKWDSTVYKNLQKSVGTMISGDRKEFAQIELTTGTDVIGQDEDVAAQDISEEDKVNAIDAETNGKGPETAGPAEPKPEEKKAEKGPGLSPDDQKAFDQLAVTAREFPKEYQQALKDLKVSAKMLTMTAANAETARQIFKKVNEIVDKQQ